MVDKPFNPWRTGDAFSINDMMIENGQIRSKYFQDLYFKSCIKRYWNHRKKAWYFHTPTNFTTAQEGYTGSSIVVILILLLWIFSLYRLWVVWVETLNFDGGPSVVGWDFFSGWVSRSFKRKHSVHVDHSHDGFSNVNGTRKSFKEEFDIEKGMINKMEKNEKENTFYNIKVEREYKERNFKITDV